MKFHLQTTMTGQQLIELGERQKKGEVTVYAWAVSKTNNALWEVQWSEKLSIDKQRGFASVEVL